MAILKRTVDFPDGRNLEIILDGNGGYEYRIDTVKVTEKQAEAAWSEQPDEWHRGMGLRATMRAWGMGGD